MTPEQKTTANQRISAACPVLGRMPTKSTEHMGEDELEAAIGQMLADLYSLAVNDGCIAAGWAYEFACQTAEKSSGLATMTAERDKLLKEHEEDQGVIRVWRGRTERAEAERDKLLSAANRVLQWFAKPDSEDAGVLGELASVVVQVEK